MGKELILDMRTFAAAALLAASAIAADVIEVKDTSLLNHCGDEWGSCDCAGIVYYGKHSTWTSKDYSGNGVVNVPCTNANFGDPLHGTVKSCYCYDVDQEVNVTDYLTGFTLANMMEMLSANEEVTAAFEDNVRSHLAAYKEEVMAELPEVCGGGQACRDALWDLAKADIIYQWQLALGDIKYELENLMLISQTHLDDGYNNAFECEPECPCADIGDEYLFLVEAIDVLKDEIADLEELIDGWWDEIAEIEETCPDYEHYRVEYAAEWEAAGY